MTIYAVFYHGHFIAHFSSRYEADRFIMNCRLCMSYDGYEGSCFEVEEV